jgi:hypothetical protein
VRARVMWGRCGAESRLLGVVSTRRAQRRVSGRSARPTEDSQDSMPPL